MIDPAITSLEGEWFPVWIEAGKVRELLRALHDTSPFDPEGTIPPTFLTTMFFWERDVAGADLWPQVGMDPKRGMHAEQEYEFFGPPPRAGDRLRARSHIDRVYEKTNRRGATLTFVELVTSFYGEDDVLVARARMTAVEQGAAAAEPAPEKGGA